MKLHWLWIIAISLAQEHITGFRGKKIKKLNINCLSLRQLILGYIIDKQLWNIIVGLTIGTPDVPLETHLDVMKVLLNQEVSPRASLRRAYRGNTIISYKEY